MDPNFRIPVGNPYRKLQGYILFNSQSYHFMLISRHQIPPFYTFSTAIRGALVLLVDDVEEVLVLVLLVELD